MLGFHSITQALFIFKWLVLLFNGKIECKNVYHHFNIVTHYEKPVNVRKFSIIISWLGKNANIIMYFRIKIHFCF